MTDRTFGSAPERGDKALGQDGQHGWRLAEGSQRVAREDTRRVARDDAQQPARDPQVVREDTQRFERGTPPPPPPASVDGSRGDGLGRARLGWRQYLAVAVVAALASAAVVVPTTLLEDEPAVDAGAEPTAVSDQAGPIRFEAEANMVEAIAAQVGPSVVRIDVQSGFAGGSGSGVIYSSDGFVLTNAHVVRGARDVGVTMPDGQQLDAEVVGADPTADIAVLKVDATDLPVPAFAEQAPQVGGTAVAIGSPFGLDGSVTAGVVSATNRTVNEGGAPQIDMIQTDAAINPGNSGGALVNGEGEVMGINTAIVSRSGGNDGIGFAVPIGAARAIADQLIETGSVEHAFLGISGQTIDPAVAQLYGLPVEAGAVVAEVGTGTPADAAGLERGDIVVGMDGEDITSMEELAARIQRHAPGDTVSLEVVRGSDELSLDVELAARPTG